MEYEVEGKNIDVNSLGFFLTFGLDSLDPDRKHSFRVPDRGSVNPSPLGDGCSDRGV